MHKTASRSLSLSLTGARSFSHSRLRSGRRAGWLPDPLARCLHRTYLSITLTARAGSLSLSLSLSPSLSRALSLSLSLSLSLTLSLSLYIYSRDSIVKNYNREGEKTRDPQRSGTRKAIWLANSCWQLRGYATDIIRVARPFYYRARAHWPPRLLGADNLITISVTRTHITT